MRKTDVPALTGLRGIAAIWVVGYHINLWTGIPLLPDLIFRYGFCGVDVFFLLSGYLLASLHADLKPSGWKRFFLRRWFRIFPLHLFVMTGLAVLVLVLDRVGLSLGYHTWSTFLPVLCLVQVFTRSGGWNDPTWSIGVELVSYLLLPLLIPILRRISQPAMAVVGALLVVLDVALAIYTIRPYRNFLVTPFLGPIPILRGLLGFFAGAAFSRCVGMSDLRLGFMDVTLSWWPIFWIGEVSYSIYLLHGPILTALDHAEIILIRHGIGAAFLPLAIMLILMTSAITHRWIEVPARKLGRRLG